jgi:GTP-binding protein
LRHVARARLLALVLDASEDPEGSEATLRAELYAAKLSDRPTVVVLNKIDTLDGELRQYLREAFPDSLQVSALTGEGVEGLRDLLEKRLRSLGEQQLDRINAGDGRVEHRAFKPTFRGLRVEEVEEGVYEVSGEDVVRLALRTDWDNTEGVANFQRELEKKGVVAALKKAGAEPGDDIRVGEVEFGFQ